MARATEQHRQGNQVLQVLDEKAQPHVLVHVRYSMLTCSLPLPLPCAPFLHRVIT